MVFLLVLSACQPDVQIGNKDELKIVVANDLHFAHQSIIGNHERSQDITTKADGKQINYLGELTEAFIDQMKREKPDVIILNGDIVFNGERDNHLYLIDLLSQLDALILVNPGNHDIDSKDAIMMKPHQSYRMGSVTSKEFEKLYHQFGYKQARSKDHYSLSYIVEVSDSLDIVMLDSRCDQSCEDIHGGQIKPETLDWLESELKLSKEKDKDILVASHHPILVHYQRLRNGFTINNDQEVIELLNKYDVKLTLSGHIHVQHIATESDLVDITTQAMSVYQNQVGVIQYKPQKHFKYSTQHIDVSAYAQSQGWDNPELLNFDKTALETITYVNYRRTALRLFDEMNILDEDELLDIASYDAKIKAHYFSGQLENKLSEFLEDPYFNELVEKYPQSTQNMISALENFGQRDHRNITIELGK